MRRGPRPAQHPAAPRRLRAALRRGRDARRRRPRVVRPRHPLDRADGARGARGGAGDPGGLARCRGRPWCSWGRATTAETAWWWPATCWRPAGASGCLAPGGEPPRTPDGATMTTIASTIGIRVEPFPAGEPHPAGAVAVDALLGTGATGPPRDAVAGAVAWLRAHPGPVVALDVPTGVESDTGRVPGDAVRADLTVTFHGDMAGAAGGAGPRARRSRRRRRHRDPHGRPARAGRLARRPRRRGGHPAQGPGLREVRRRRGAGDRGRDRARRRPRPGRPGDAARRGGPDGRGRSRGGAAAHRRRAAGGDGRGAARRRRGAPDRPGAEEALAQAGRVGAVALGPGLGRADGTGDAVAALLAGLEKPLVLDADGLWHLHAAPERLRERPAPTVHHAARRRGGPPARAPSGRRWRATAWRPRASWRSAPAPSWC